MVRRCVDLLGSLGVYRRVRAGLGSVVLGAAVMDGVGCVRAAGLVEVSQSGNVRAGFGRYWTGSIGMQRLG